MSSFMGTKPHLPWCSCTGGASTAGAGTTLGANWPIGFGSSRGRPVTWVGHSMGGMIVQKFGELFPHQLGAEVERIVLVGTTYTNPLRHTPGRRLALALQKPLIEPMLRLTIALSPLVRAMNWMSYQNGSMHISTRIGSFGGSQTWKEVDFAARIGVEQSPAVMARMALAMLEFDAQASDPRIGIPTLLLHGRNDRTLQVDAGEEIAQLITRSELNTFENTGHQLILERHEDFASQVARFAHKRKPNPAVA
jgi:pimeloyl-ACP methyl ester carboxylesterase